MLKDSQMSMQEIAGFLLSGESVTEAVTENDPSEEMISVTDAAPEIPEKRKRGRPPKAGEAMTPAERARRYRQKRRPAWRARRVELWASTVERAEKIAAENGYSVAGVLDWALNDHSVRLLSHDFERAKAAAAKAGVDVDTIIRTALYDIADERLDEIAEAWIRYKAEKVQSESADENGA